MAGSMRLVRGKETWELRVYAGRDQRGRVRHVHRTFHGTKRAAQLELARLAVEQAANPIELDPEPLDEPEVPSAWDETTTVNDAITAWRANGWEDLSPKTVRGYEEIWYRYVRDSIGTRRITSLNPYEVERFFRKLKEAGAKKDTVRRVRNLLHRACRLASRWSRGQLPNPIANTELPTWSFTEQEPVRAPEVDEVRALLRAGRAYDERIGVFLQVLAATGMRRGEAAALRWSDVDFQEGSVTVDESVVAARGGAVLKAPKTRASIRRLALDAGTVSALGGIKKKQTEVATACGHSLDIDDFVFALEPGTGAPPHPEAMTHAFARVRKLAGIASDIHLHSLRHFHATVVDPVISEAQKQARLGWSTVQMARHYTDAIGAEDRRAAKHVGDLLADGPRRRSRRRR